MVLTEKGYNRPTYSDILDQQIERAKVLFGEDIETDEKTPLGKYIRINAQDIAELHEILETVYYARFPDSATGQSLDRLLPFAGITRNQASYAKHKIKFTGTAGETIPGGFLVAAGGLQFYTLEDYLIDEGGTVTGFVYCEQSGSIGNVPTGKIDTIVESSPDVLSIEHLGVVGYGEDIENDVALRIRFRESVAGAGSATTDAIRGAISRVPFVDGVEIIENDTDKAVDGISPHSFECFVLSPESQDKLVAEAIFSKKPIGIKCAGKIEVEVTDKGGKSHIVRFSRTIRKEIYMKISINTSGTFEHNGIQQIKDNIALYINNLKNGEDVYLSSIFGYIHQITGVVNVPKLQLSTNGSTYNSANIEVGLKEVARIELDNIEVVVEGMITNV